MDVAVVGRGWWHGACTALGAAPLELPLPAGESEGPYSADVAARLAVGRAWRPLLEHRRPAFMVDNGAAGLAFVERPDCGQKCRLLHEVTGTPLVSHLIDPLVTALEAMPSETIWECLGSHNWIKAVWDQAQVIELERFGVPSVIHLPMAALDRPYCTDPLGEPTVPAAVSFVGGQNTAYFTEEHTVPAPTLLPGTLAQAVQRELGPISFFEVYYNLYGLGEPPSPSDSIETVATKADSYFNHKLFYSATRCIRQRDRFVVFLKRQLGDDFLLIGPGWDRAYGLDCRPALESYDDYLQHFRQVPVNLNLVNGNAETGLNMRHFEITAAGGFMLCGHQAEIDRYFKVGTECDTFTSEGELLDKVRYYLAHPDQRREMALAGQRRTLSEHLYSHRLKTLMDMVQAGQATDQAAPAAASR